MLGFWNSSITEAGGPLTQELVDEMLKAMLRETERPYELPLVIVLPPGLHRDTRRYQD